MPSWTDVSVRERGRFCFCVVRLRFERLGRGRMRREAMMRTWRSENFFSSSRVRLSRRQKDERSTKVISKCQDRMCTHRCWTLCQPGSSGTGTKITMAFLPWPTSICKNPGVSNFHAAQCPSPLRVERYVERLALPVKAELSLPF